MRILIVNFRYWPSINAGSQLSTKILAESLISRGHEVFVLTCDHFNHLEHHNGVHIYYIKSPMFNYRELTFFKKLLYRTLDIYNILSENMLSKIIRNISPDIIHTNCIQEISVSIWNVAYRLKIPIVHTIRDFYLICRHAMMKKNGDPCSSNCISCQLYSKIHKQIAKKVTSLVSISQYMLDVHLKKKIFSEDIKKYIIYNCVPESLKSNPYPLHCLSIGYIGRIEPEKGVELLIKNFCKINKKDVRLIIAGNGNLRYIDHLKTKYQDTRIKWIGLSEQNQFYKMVDLVVIPSLWNEPFGRVAIEAIYANRPIIISNRGGLSEILKQIPFGVEFNPNDEDSLFNHLYSFVYNEEYYKSFSHRYKNLNIFTNSIITTQYEEAYKETIRYWEKFK